MRFEHGFLAVIVTCMAWATDGMAQGALTPPGAPAETMRTLEQVEPRVPIATAAYTITAPGSYYLTGDVIAAGAETGIWVRASGVTIDLNGFSLIGGGAGSGPAIYQRMQYHRLTVVNGVISNWDDFAISAEGRHNRFSGLRLGDNWSGIFSSGPGAMVDRCQLYRNGSSGAFLGDGAHVTDSVFYDNGDGVRVGVGSLVQRCTAYDNDYTGIAADDGSTVLDCSAFGNWDGITAGNGATVQRCAVRVNAGDGIAVKEGGRVADCVATRNTGDGIQANKDAVIRDNTCEQNGYNDGDGAAIHVTLYGCVVENNTATGSDRGLDIDGANNEVGGNTVRDNEVNYAIADGNRLSLLIGEVPQRIPWPAYVELAGSLSCTGGVAIEIEADGVTVDLGGHTLTGPGAGVPSTGIRTTSGNRGCSIRNGAVREFQYAGVDVYRTTGSRVDGVSAISNGMYGIAVRSSEGCIVENTTCMGNEDAGFHATVGGGHMFRGCTASENLGRGFYFWHYGDDSRGIMMERCTSSGNGKDGIAFLTTSGHWDNNSVIDCTIVNNGLTGVAFRVLSGRCNGNTVRGCTIGLNVGPGIGFAYNSGWYIGNVIQENTLCDNGGTGIEMYRCRRSRVDGNSLTRSSSLAGVYAIFTDAASCQNNLIVRNFASGFVSNYSISPSDTYGPLCSDVGALPAAGAGVHPWANFDR